MGHGPCLCQGELVPQVYVLVSQNEGRGSWSTPGIHVPGITNDSVSEKHQLVHVWLQVREPGSAG